MKDYFVFKGGDMFLLFYNVGDAGKTEDRGIHCGRVGGAWFSTWWRQRPMPAKFSSDWKARPWVLLSLQSYR